MGLMFVLFFGWTWHGIKEVRASSQGTIEAGWERVRSSIAASPLHSCAKPFRDGNATYYVFSPQYRSTLQVNNPVYFCISDAGPKIARHVHVCMCRRVAGCLQPL